MTALSGLGAQERPTESVASAPLHVWTREYSVAARGEQSLRELSAPSSPPVLSIMAEALGPQPWAECTGHSSVPGSIIPSCWADPHTQRLQRNTGRGSPLAEL